MMSKLTKIGMAVMMTVAAASPAAEVRLVESKESGWPQWRGPRRDGVSAEKGLLPAWQEGGPRLLRKVSKIGKGYSSPIVSGGIIYITGDEDDKLYISALDLSGNLKWKVQNGKSWTGSYPGARSSCSHSDGRIYHMNAHGRLVCLSAGDGKELWSVDTLEKYESGNITWGISEAPLVIDGKVIVTPAGKSALMVALDQRTGREIWKADPLDGKPNYSSSIIIDVQGRHQIVNGNSTHTFGVDAKTGRILWQYPHEISGQMATNTPGFHEGAIIVSNAQSSGGKYYSLALGSNGRTVEKKWTQDIGNPLGSVICANGYVVGSSKYKPKGWACIDVATGEIEKSRPEIDYGSGIFADGKFYCLSSTGKMMLMDAGKSKLTIVSEFDFMTGKKNVWANPVICDGRLFLRYEDVLYFYSVSG
jgi:outer membrane protein assembly factor BamB